MTLLTIPMGVPGRDARTAKWFLGGTTVENFI
jgi:hypothetical protein